MNMLKLIYAYAGHVMLWTFVLRALFASVTPAWFAQSPTQKILCLVLLALPSLVIAYFTLGMLSQLSAAFTFLLFIGLTHFVHGFPPSAMPVWLFAGVAFTGLLLYASALGFMRIDLYAWGYQARWLALVAVILALALWASAPIVSWALAFALLAFALQIGASRNLWDYLLDPILFFTAVYLLVRHFIRG
ncbi:MAG: hypothetical protein RL020_1344 [Pseudomonadota bacterium]|jgi:hypothetical protein